MNIKDIILVILVLGVIYLMYKTNKMEHFETVSTQTVDASVNKAINDKYSVDLNPIRELSQFMNNINTGPDTYKIPVSNVYMNNLIVDEHVKFTNKDTVYLDIFPKYMIIPWNNIINSINKVPKGWVLCDGNKYSLNNNNDAILDINGIQTPNLQGRFLVGSGLGRTGTGSSLDTITGSILLTKKFGDYGGEEKHALTISEIPSHKHNYLETISTGEGGDGWWYGGSGYKFRQNNAVTKDTGIATPHNNIPPFYVLNYIMKL